MKMMSSILGGLVASLAAAGPLSKQMVATRNSSAHHLSSNRDTYAVEVETRHGVRIVHRKNNELGKKMYRDNGDVFVMTRQGFRGIRRGHSKHHRAGASA